MGSVPILSAQRWAHTWGGSGNDEVSAVSTDQNGNAYFVGATSSFGVGSQNVLVQKYASGGSLTWSVVWGGTANDYANGVGVDSSGNVYVTGATSSFGAGWYDVFLLKFNSSGTLLWNKTWGGSSFDVGYDLAFDGANNVYVAAESYSLGNRAVVLKFDPNGNLLSTAAWKGPSTYDSGYSITLDPSDNVILAGVSWDYSVSPNHNSILLLKYDDQGHFVWNRNIVTGAEDQAGGSKIVRTDSAGNIYIAGNRAAVCQSSNFSTCNFDADVIKLGPNGNLIWASSWGGTGYQSSGGLVFDQNGNLVVSGTTNSFLSGNNSLMLLTFSTAGSVVASRVWGGNGSVNGGGNTMGTDGNILIAGSAPNGSGTWQNVTASTTTPTVTLGNPPGNVITSPLAVGAPEATLTLPTGIINIGGGGSDALAVSAASVSELKPVVLVIPGIGASTLTDLNGIDQWLSCTTIQLLSQGLNINPLQYDVFGHPATILTPRDILTATDSISEVPTSPTQSIVDCPTTNLINLACLTGWVNCAAATTLLTRTALQGELVSASQGALLQFNDPNPAQNLLARLASNGYSPQPWPYDFRRDINELADDLYVTVQQIPSEFPGRRIAIVAHSMGSLVTAAMIARHPGVVLSNVISLGAPFEGGAATYLDAAGFQSFAPAFLSAPNTAQVGNNWTSVYELLPQWPFVYDRDKHTFPPISSVYQGSFDPVNLPVLPRANSNSILAAQSSVWNELSGLSSQPFWSAIIGYNQPTPQQITKSDELVSSDPESTPATISLSHPCYSLESDDGDGSVPLLSAQYGVIPAQTIYVSGQHSMLPKNADVISGILNILQGESPFTASLLSYTQFQQSRATTPFRLQNTILINSCSPIALVVTDSIGRTTSSLRSQIPSSTYANVGTATQIMLPWDDSYQLQLSGTASGSFDLVVREFGGQHTPLSYIFRAVPVLTGSQGTVAVGGSIIPTLQYNYTGRTMVDYIPANVTPPTVECTGAYVAIQNLRATFSFNVGYAGGVSTFAYNYRSASQSVQFLSTSTTHISVSRNTSTFSGQGTLNGQAGYSFTVTATDGGPIGSGLDTISITITGPSGYLYTAGGPVIGGDIVVHQ